MGKTILEKSSFGLIRTNPKLTTNVKLITDSSDQLYLESFDATKELSKAKYKGYKVSSTSDYYFDLYRFYNQRKATPKTDIYNVFKKDRSLSIKDKYGLQYDTTYGYGAQTKPSKMYNEEFSLFAPIWIEPTNIPDYFIICRTEDPVSVSTKNIVNENDPSIIDLVENPLNFTDNILKKSKIIKSFDLTNRSNLGRYLRNHAANPLFPESSILADWIKDKYFKYNGMAVDKPGFASRVSDMFTNSWATDKTIIEYESIITSGFQELSMVQPNIINLEFLFDDEDTNTYEFYRYFGLYVNKAEYNKFLLDGNALFQDRFNQITQLPIPILNDIGYADNIEDQIQTNINGIVVYPELPPISSIGGTSFFSSEIVENKPRIGYLQDTNENFHKIKNDSNFSAGTLRLDDTSVNWKNFTGFTEPENYVTSSFNLYNIDKPGKMNGRPACVIQFVNTPLDDDEFRLLFTDTTDPAQLGYIDTFTMTATSTLPAGTSISNLYSTKGTLENVAQSFTQCVNNTNSYYPDQTGVSAVANGSKVIIFSRVASSTWNKIKVTSFSQALTEDQIAINFISGQLTPYFITSYESSPQPFTSVFGWLSTGSFVGGNDNPRARIKIKEDSTSLFSTSKYLVTENGYSKIENVIPYIDEPIYNDWDLIIGFKDFNNYYTVNIENTSENISLTSSLQCSIVSLRSNECGLLSIYPFKDFDFDFYSTQYNKDADANVNELRNFYLGTTGPYGATSSFGATHAGLTGASGWIDSIIGPDSPFELSGGYQKLMGISDELTDTDSIIYNEYDRLTENDLTQLAIQSRVVPFVNKWVYDDDGLDVRQNPYRLDTSPAFRYPNFGPSFREFSSNPKFYTHEWYYLQQYPPYMDFDERSTSYSYFETPINIGSTYASGATTFGIATITGSTSVTTDFDYFTEYFTRESIGGTAVTAEVKYNVFAYGTNQRFSETFFRGAKVVIKPRIDYDPVNYNIGQIKFQKSTKYNEYKFAAVIRLVENGITFKVIENEEFKTITLVIEAGLMDDLFTKYGSAPIGTTAQEDHFIDRTLMYTLKDELILNPGATGYEPSNVQLSGAIKNWDLPDSLGNVQVYGTQNGLGTCPAGNDTWPNFISEMQQNPDGSYNDIQILNSINPLRYWQFEGISTVAANTFVCSDINEYFVGTNLPTGQNLFIPYYIGQNVLSFYDCGVWAQVPTYFNGGYDAYRGLINALSFANIADQFQSGNPEIEYTTYKKDGSIIYNDKVLELTMPIESYKANYLKPIEDLEIPQELNIISDSSVIGYQISAMPRAIVNVLSRYNGRYQPKFRDIFFFKDYENSYGATGPRHYGFDKYSNLEFNLDEPDFGLIQNYFFNKVNPENPQGILKLSTASSTPSLYPKVGEVAINKRDMYGFLSNWDIDYYQKSLDRTQLQSTVGYRGVIENKAFFGSKIISVPDTITLENFDLINLEDIDGGLNNIDNVPESVVKSENRTSSRSAGVKKLNTRRIQLKNQLVLNVFTTKSLTKFLRADGFDTEFNKYINPAFTFGDAGLDDDIENYIKENIYQRYVVKKITFFENQFENNVNDLKTIELDMSTFDLFKTGYKVSENVSIKFSPTSPLNFEMIYNIPKLDNYSISFKVELEKK